MARFRGTVQGRRGEASRLGDLKSGLQVDSSGWNIGVRVDARATVGANDAMCIDLTGGSNNDNSVACIDYFNRLEDGKLEVAIGTGFAQLIAPNEANIDALLSNKELARALTVRLWTSGVIYEPAT